MLAFLQNVGGTEWLVILFVALLLFGHRLPQMMRSLGRSTSEFKKGMREGEEELAKTPAQQQPPAPAPPAPPAPPADHKSPPTGSIPVN
jgi:sec-independent protein translocase protein TatA